MWRSIEQLTTGSGSSSIEKGRKSRKKSSTSEWIKVECQKNFIVACRRIYPLEFTEWNGLAHAHTCSVQIKIILPCTRHISSFIASSFNSLSPWRELNSSPCSLSLWLWIFHRIAYSNPQNHCPRPHRVLLSPFKRRKEIFRSISFYHCNVLSPERRSPWTILWLFCYFCSFSSLAFCIEGCERRQKWWRKKKKKENFQQR